jgi:virginiamycin B lyase
MKPHALLFALLSFSVPLLAIAATPTDIVRRPIGELTSTAVIHLGKTADWVAVTEDFVWVGSTGPNAVHKIDPRSNQEVATVHLPGEPCAGLAIGFGSLWIPLCAKHKALAKVDLQTNKLMRIFKIGVAGAESGITTGADSVWLMIDKHGSLARIDPATGRVLRTDRIPAGSYNPLYSDGQIWVTRASGSEITDVDANTGQILARVPTGPGPRFLTAGAGAIWSLNQGDGSLSRIDSRTKQATATIALGIPGHGGDLTYAAGMVWITFAKVPLSLFDASTTALRCQWVGAGGDSLGISHGAIWLTDYHAGTVARIEISDALTHCGMPTVSAPG